MINPITHLICLKRTCYFLFPHGGNIIHCVYGKKWGWMTVQLWPIRQRLIYLSASTPTRPRAVSRKVFRYIIMRPPPMPIWASALLAIAGRSFSPTRISVSRVIITVAPSASNKSRSLREHVWYCNPWKNRAIKQSLDYSTVKVTATRPARLRQQN